MPPKLSLERAKNLLSPRFSEATEIISMDYTAPASGTLSPNGSKTPSTVNRTVEGALIGCNSLNEKILELQELVLRTSPKYVVYNEIARLQYELAQEHPDDALALQRTCLDSIENAKGLVDKNPNTHANTKAKSIVYYNHSQFNTALYFLWQFKDPAMLQHALDSANKAIAIVDKETDKDYYQDYMVHKAFIMPYIGQRDGAKVAYSEAFRINPLRFIEEYTTEGRGKELILFIISNDMDELMKDVVQLKCDTIDPNALTGMGWSVLQFAIQCGKAKIAEQLLELGADPLYGGIDSDTTTPLVEALSKGLWIVADKMLTVLSKVDRIKEIDFNTLKVVAKENENDIEDIDQGIQKLFDKYKITFPDPHTYSADAHNGLLTDPVCSDPDATPPPIDVIGDNGDV